MSVWAESKTQFQWIFLFCFFLTKKILIMMIRNKTNSPTLMKSPCICSFLIFAAWYFRESSLLVILSCCWVNESNWRLISFNLGSKFSTIIVLSWSICLFTDSWFKFKLFYSCVKVIFPFQLFWTSIIDNIIFNRNKKQGIFRILIKSFPLTFGQISSKF